MVAYLVFCSLLAVCISKVHSQACPVVLPPPCAPCVPAPTPCPPPIAPSPCLQVINPNPQVTTIIDNSISNALVNALQLLIVSNLIGSSASPPVVGNLGPLLETLVCATPCGTPYPEVPEYIIPCPTLEIIPPCAPLPCPNFELIPPCTTPCGPKFDLIPPCGPIIDFPPPFCGLTDIISPNFFTYTEPSLCIDNLPPTFFNGHEAIFPLYGIDGPNYCGLTEIVSPNYYPVADLPCYGFAELPGLALAPMFGGLAEVGPNVPIPIYGGMPEVAFGPLAALTPNYYGGLTEVSQVPLAAEVVFPSALPAQLTCNFGYTQSSLPCVRLNVEPLPYDICNGYGGPLFY